MSTWSLTMHGPGEITMSVAVFNAAAYPINDPSSPAYADLVARCRADLDLNQYCILADFVLLKELTQIVRDVLALEPRAYTNSSNRNCFLQRRKDAALHASHPRNIFFDASYRMIANDLFAEDSPLKRLYHDPATIRFVADVVGEPELYPSADRYQPINVLCYAPGDNSAWHFDSSNAFTMTLMLQSAEGGGEFEIAPNTRAEDDPMYEALAEVLLGDRSRVVTVPRSPGTLVIFRGCNSVHRVTEVEGARQRLMAVFVYETAPGIVGEPEVNETVYGPRTRP
jgi:2OG-Fe(II) oxygenase superfamily